MKLTQAFSMAFKSMSQSKMRSFLTMLGIIIGVAAVIVLVSLVGGFSADLSSSFESMGTTNLSVMLMGRGDSTVMEPDEMMALKEQHSDLLSLCSPEVSVSATLKHGTASLSGVVTGGSEDYHLLSGYTLAQGRAVAYADLAARSKVAVIGSYVEQELFEGEQAVGQTLKINGDAYTVVGVFEETEDSSESSSDNVVIIPYTTAQRLGRSARITSYTLSAVSADKVEAAMELLESTLYEKTGNEDYYRVSSVSQRLDTVNELTGTLTLVLVGIAGISLLVGGIGIMNIMLVSVTERTREIGIRKSLGGKRRDILRQFVIEAAVTSAAGGLLGIVLGIGAAYLVGSLMDMTVVISGTAVLVAFSVSVGIGVLFGYSPAAKASRLNPIEALHYE